ncbi:MAG: hypothetical protein HC821_00110 [Lewinella sp.]|nr:hypothetical protein [Lewinella sp.]
MRKIVAIVLVLGVLMSQWIAVVSCANPFPPEGGPRDTLGPKLVLEATTPGFQTNFRPQELALTFDEWVKIKDPNQIIISPPIEPQPKVSLKRRTLTIDFGEAILRDSATYVISIGGAVVDLSEGNPPNNLRFVFATGPVLDSASVNGLIVDAYTGSPVKEVLFVLYANVSDTAVNQENPFYFARTDKDGRYEVSNIRPGTYRAFAFDNGPLGGYRYTPLTTKQIGLLDSLLSVPNGRMTLAPVRLSSPAPPFKNHFA